MMDSFPISLIRQFLFCPRIPYFNEIRGIRGLHTPWAELGKLNHEKEEELVQRRSFEFLGFGEPNRIDTSVRLESKSLGVHGVADAILIWTDFIVVVEFKTVFEPKKNWRKNGQTQQALAYASLAEERYNKKCRCILISLIRMKNQKFRYHLLEVTDEKRIFIQKKIESIRDIIKMEKLPNSSAAPEKCVQCEYLNYCNDRNF